MVVRCLILLGWLVSVWAGAQTLEIRVKALQNGTLDTNGEIFHRPEEMAKFYAARGYQPAWTTELQLEMMAAIRTVGGDGLIPAEYHLETLERTFNPEMIDLMLTDAYLALGDHLYAGRLDAMRVNPEWAVKRKKSEVRKYLEMAIASGHVNDTLAELAPKDPRYGILKNALVNYRASAAAGAFPKVSPGPKLHPGSRGKRVVELRARLAREGFLSPRATTSQTFGPDLETAVKAFQAARGLGVDGVVGNDGLAALNLPAVSIVRKIVANLERLRWMPRELGDRYLLVDIPGYALTIFDHGQPATKMRVVVGADKKRTPMLATHLSSVVLNPNWMIPGSIAGEEVLPMLQADPAYAKKRGLRILQTVHGRRVEVDPQKVDWSSVTPESFPYLLEEPAGERNALGQVKFLIPNRYAIYLHGSPHKAAFDREKRSLSHGCVRVEDPVALAFEIMKNSPSPWSESDLEVALVGGETLKLAPSTSLPVYLWYRTAWLDEADTQLQIRSDIYGWDEMLAKATEGRSSHVSRDLP